jgi:predicted N-acetyltransferase YhbS
MGGLSRPRSLSSTDDREAFDCGRDSLNAWFCRHAWSIQENGASRTSVICDLATGSVAGYVALSAGQIERAYLPKRAQLNKPDPVPIILLGQLAVDLRYQRRGCARSLMVFVLRTALRVSADIGCIGIVTQPLHDEVRSFYDGFDF